MRQYFLERKPVLDMHGHFMFFGNHKAGLTSVNRWLLKDRAVPWKGNHKKYRKMFKLMSDKDLENIFKFTIVRNPFDRTVSAFFYLKKHGIIPKKSFSEFIKEDFSKEGISINGHFHMQTPSAFYEGEQFVDFIAKLENIKKDWKNISSKIKCLHVLPHKNRTRHNPYKTYYDEESIQIVSEIYAEDLKNFGYKFGR
ncbi:MAG: sulfotransferase family 2 domain-containing protein [Melioribacteraceae bacterium]|nr:sulfotransferase family 2 domain-containing protein [Melioribacteraceae bacterium]